MYVDLYDDQKSLNHQKQPTPNVLLQLKQIEATLKKAAEGSQDEKSIRIEKLVGRFREELEQLLEDPLPRLKQ